MTETNNKGIKKIETNNDWFLSCLAYLIPCLLVACYYIFFGETKESSKNIDWFFSFLLGSIPGLIGFLAFIVYKVIGHFIKGKKQLERNKKSWWQVQGWLVAFFVPFIIVFALGMCIFYMRGLDDLARTHHIMGIESSQPGDDWEAIISALPFASAVGSGMGGIILILYTCLIGFCKLLKKQSTQRS